MLHLSSPNCIFGNIALFLFAIFVHNSRQCVSFSQNSQNHIFGNRQTAKNDKGYRQDGYAVVCFKKGLLLLQGKQDCLWRLRGRRDVIDSFFHQGDETVNIIRVLNTNAVVTLDPDGREIIVTGAGIGFRKKRGELLDDALVDRIYRLESNEESRKLQEFVQAVSEKYLDIAEKVVQAARIEEGLKIKDTLYVTLTDHINSALDRHQAGIELKNMIRPDIQKFYPKEYAVGLKGIRWIREATGVELGADEAAFIAMHIIASELDNNTPADVQKMTELINTILHIIRLHFKIVFHEDSFSYQRFITHLKFFSARIFSHEPYKDSMKEIYDVLIEQNTYVFSGVQKVAEFIQKKYDYTLSIDESLYLLIHLKRILDEEQETK